jgi:hypothetical protein
MLAEITHRAAKANHLPTRNASVIFQAQPATVNVHHHVIVVAGA